MTYIYEGCNYASIIFNLQPLQFHPVLYIDQKIELMMAVSPHPFDPLSESEIERAVAIIRKEHSDVFFNAITLLEPRKAEMMKWLKDPEHTPRPNRVADVVCIGRGSKVHDGHADLTEGKIVTWALTDDVQPLVSWEENSMHRTLL